MGSGNCNKLVPIVQLLGGTKTGDTVLGMRSDEAGEAKIPYSPCLTPCPILDLGLLIAH